MSIGLAFKAFFAVLFRKDAAEAVRMALQATDTIKKLEPPFDTKKQGLPAQQVPGPAGREPQPSLSKRSEALTLLSSLQREARFLDLVSEPLDSFDDAQIGAAAREVIRDCKKSLDRMFGIEPLSSSDEGTVCELPKDLSAVKYRVMGKAASSPASGVVAHRGWKATRCQLPTWTGSTDDGWVLAPIEVEVG